MSAWAYATPGDFRMEATRTEEAPTIDGVLDDEVWSKAPVVTNFIDIATKEPAEDQTTARLLYDDRYIYVGLEMLESDPDSIVGTIYKYDRFELRLQDYIQIWFDTFHDHKRAYTYLISPLGTRWDARDGVYERNPSWDSSWEAKAVVLDDRWVAEARIPISEMLFSGGDNMTWGLNFRRSDRNQNAWSHWSFNPEGGANRDGVGPSTVADFGVLEGIDLSNVKTPLRPSYETYVSSTVTRRELGGTSRKGSAGADIKMRVGSQFVTTLTINPDFGQVEADSDDIQLRDIERFLPERRPFFQDGNEVFISPLKIYNSRRITDIDYGAKVTGTGRNWTLGIQDLEGEGVNSGEANFLVARYTHSLTNNLQVGGVWVSAERENGYNYVGGVDARYEFTDTLSLTGQYLEMEDKREVVVTDSRGAQYLETERKHAHGLDIELTKQGTNFSWLAGYRDIHEDFNPDLAFIPRRDIVGFDTEGEYERQIDGKYVEAIDLEYELAYYWNHDGFTTLRDFQIEAGIDFQNDIDIDIRREENYRRPFDNSLTGIFVGYRRNDLPKSMYAFYSWGEFQDVPFKSISINKPYQLTKRLTGELDVDFRREDRPLGEEDVWLVRHVNEYNFEWGGRLRLILEESSEERYNRTLLFAYEDIKDWDFYLLLNDTKADGEEVQGAFAKFVKRF